MDAAPVLVGVDGSAPSMAAVDLALREAGLRDHPVRVVYADPWARHPAWHDSGDLAEELLSDPQAIVRAALDRAAAAGTGLTVTGEVLPGDAAGVLIHESASAALTVLGHRGHGGFPELLLGSVAAKVAAHAAGTVLVTRGELPGTGPVLLGVDAMDVEPAAVGFAFQEAAWRGAEVLAVHAWTGPFLSGPTDLLVYDPDLDRREREQRLAEALAGWRAAYPEVPVRAELVWGRAGRALVAAGTGAQLAVVGPRGTGGLPGRRLGAVTHALLHHAPCPVAVVHGG